MSREEAIDILKCDISADKQGIEYCHDEIGIEALDMAIKALEQEPSGDAISRQAVNEIINDIRDCISVEGYCAIFERLKKLPSINPQEPKWIPVSERLPNKSGKYWCTFGGTNLTGTDFYTTKDDAEIDFDEPDEYVGWRSQNVIAWMPLPEPYKAESEEV